jgi:hypothetical protein
VSNLRTLEDSLGSERDRDVKIIYGGPSLSYSYENHVLKLY